MELSDIIQTGQMQADVGLKLKRHEVIDSGRKSGVSGWSQRFDSRTCLRQAEEVRPERLTLAKASPAFFSLIHGSFNDRRSLADIRLLLRVR